MLQQLPFKMPKKKKRKGAAAVVSAPLGRRPRVSKRRLREILPFLQTFKDLQPTQRGIMLAHLDDKSCEVLYEAISNVLQNPTVTEAQRKRLKKVLQPHRQCLRSLISRRGSRASKRKKLQQIGGFPFAAILGTAIPLLVNLLTSRRR